jgi:hypothetical protein
VRSGARQAYYQRQARLCAHLAVQTRLIPDGLESEGRDGVTPAPCTQGCHPSLPDCGESGSHLGGGRHLTLRCWPEAAQRGCCDICASGFAVEDLLSRYGQRCWVSTYVCA